jgi:hypothetical protein
MNNTNKTYETTTRETRRNGAARLLTVVTVTWTREDGRAGYHRHEFNSAAEAANWIRWS